MEFLELIRDFRNKNKIIVSVCVGALPVAKSGILKNRNAITYNQTEYRKTLENYGVNLIENTIVIDDNIITSNGPSTALDVAFILLEALTSKENSLKVRNSMGFSRA